MELEPELYTRAIARGVPMKSNAGSFIRLRSMRKLAHIKLNRQTPSSFAKANARQVRAMWRCPGQPRMLYGDMSLPTPVSFSVWTATIPAMSAGSVAPSAPCAMPEFRWLHDVFIGYLRQHLS